MLIRDKQHESTDRKEKVEVDNGMLGIEKHDLSFSDIPV
jgi:hypothetical protein